MECKVLRENIVLEVAVTVKMEGGISAKTFESKKINFNDSLTFSAKHITLSSTNYDNYGRQQTKYQNIVLISIKKLDQNDKATYKLSLSCPEFEIQESILYVDDGNWRVVNENQKTTAYTFTITIQVETFTQVKFSILYDDDQLTDFKLKGKDGEIDIHKAFLAATSAFFKAKLLVKENVDFLEVPDTSVTTLQDFKKCIYKDILPDEHLEELLLLASYFQISWLQYKCVDKMMKDLSSGNAIKMLEFALKHRHMPLFLGIMDHVQSGGIKMSEIRKFYLQH